MGDSFFLLTNAVMDDIWMDTRMTSTAQTCRKMKRSKVALLVTVVFVVLAAAVYEFGCVFEFEYPFWPTLWLAEQTKAPDGSRVTDLIRFRSGSSYFY